MWHFDSRRRDRRSPQRGTNNMSSSEFLVYNTKSNTVHSAATPPFQCPFNPDESLIIRRRQHPFNSVRPQRIIIINALILPHYATVYFAIYFSHSSPPPTAAPPALKIDLPPLVYHQWILGEMLGTASCKRKRTVSIIQSSNIILHISQSSNRYSLGVVLLPRRS